MENLRTHENLKIVAVCPLIIVLTCHNGKNCAQELYRKVKMKKDAMR